MSCQCDDAFVLDAVIKTLHEQEAVYLEKYGRLVSKFPNTEFVQAEMKAKAALCTTMLAYIKQELDRLHPPPRKNDFWARFSRLTAALF